MSAVASTVYDLTVTAELLEDGTVRCYWSTNQPGHVNTEYDEGDEEDLRGLRAWVESHEAWDLASITVIA